MNGGADWIQWLFTEPEQGVFNFTEGDVVTGFAEENGQIMRCHALVWHSQLAPWVEEGEWTAEELRQIIVDHVTEVAGYYRGKCYAWDVVNEALNEDGTYRESVFYEVLGEEYIKLAFQVASEVDPEAKLYYNDYNLESPGPKAKGAVRIVEMLQEAGIKVDGIGMQAHLIAGSAPSLDDQIAVMESYAATGVEVAVTELDVRIEMPTNETNLEWQREVYRDVSFTLPLPFFPFLPSPGPSQRTSKLTGQKTVGACVQVDACIGVTIWDFYDPFSWVPDVFEGEGAALLWFEDFEKHPAYDGVVEALKNGTKACKPKKPHGKRSKKLL